MLTKKLTMKSSLHQCKCSPHKPLHEGCFGGKTSLQTKKCECHYQWPLIDQIYHSIRYSTKYAPNCVCVRACVRVKLNDEWLSISAWYAIIQISNFLPNAWSNNCHIIPICAYN